jgi:hypothetical protein
MNEMERPGVVDMESGNTCTTPRPGNALETVLSAPADLLAFVRGRPVREAARQLGLALGTIDRLRTGYWPTDARRILAAWSRYKCRDALRDTSWFLRRVRSGMVVHAGHRFGARDLAGRDGELIAVARTPGGELIAVALDAPAARFILVREG